MPRGKVVFEADLCKGCGLCTVVCPVDIVHMDTGTLNAKGYHPAAVTDMEKCTACGSCARFCPDSVIIVERAEAARA